MREYPPTAFQRVLFIRGMPAMIALWRATGLEKRGLAGEVGPHLQLAAEGDGGHVHFSAYTICTGAEPFLVWPKSRP